MKTLKIMLLAAIACCTVTATAQTTFETTQQVEDLEDDITGHEEIIKDKQDSILLLETRIDSLKQVIKALEANKKQLQSDVKSHKKLRQSKFEQRDNQVFALEVQNVLKAPYNKEDVDKALESFNDMETKDVLKKRKLVEEYGEYTRNLRDFLEKQRNILAEDNWVYQSASTDIYKKFEKGLKGTKYWKTYDKKEKNPSIPYLDTVVDKVMQFKNAGLADERTLGDIINMLY